MDTGNGSQTCAARLNPQTKVERRGEIIPIPSQAIEKYESVNLDFVAPSLEIVAPDLEFVAPGLDFVAADLEFRPRQADLGHGPWPPHRRRRIRLPNKP